MLRVRCGGNQGSREADFASLELAACPNEFYSRSVTHLPFERDIERRTSPETQRALQGMRLGQEAQARQPLFRDVS